uniref:Uncharacterized protein n=1 Tax=Panagrolaimus superbus TaxID=310955 RepID=A0A914YK99_9BILA
MSSTNRNIIIKGEHSLILGKVHWMNIDSRKHDSKTFFLPKRNAQEYIEQLFEESGVERKDVKAIAFIHNEHEMETWKKAYEFRKGCYDFCQKNGIFFLHSTSFGYHYFVATLRSKAVGNEGDQLTVIYCEMNAVLGQSFVRESGRWKCNFVHVAVEFENTQEWKHQFLRGYEPKKIVFMHHLDGFDFQEVIDLFNIENSVVLKGGYEYLSTGSIDKILHVMGEKPIPYDIAPQCVYVYAVNLGKDNLICVNYENVLPFEKSGIIDVNPCKTLTFGAKLAVFKPFEVIQEIELSTFKCKKLKVTLKIDVNCFYHFEVEPIDDKDLCGQFEELEILKAVEKPPFSPRKAQIIFNKHECWLHFTCDNGCTHPTPDIDGLDKTPIYIAFTEEMPLVGKAAKEVYRCKPEYVVFDIIKLCSIKSSDTANPNWGFTISKEEESLMVTLQTLDGERKSSVEFLLALIIKNALKPHVLGGSKPPKWDKAEIRFEEFIPNETLKQAFLSAGKLLKMKIDLC